MTIDDNFLRVAAAQFSPEYADMERGVEKAVAIIEAAADQGVELLVFPELWFLGYPYWASMDTRASAYEFWLQKFLNTAGSIDDPRLLPLYAAAKKHGMMLSMSIHERMGGTLYNSLLMIGATGNLEGHHRKLMPTNTERLLHGQGRGDDFVVVSSKIGNITGLLCFEHQMPLSRAAVGTFRPVVHCAQWPGHAFLNPIIDASVRQLAHENSCFVISAREVMDATLLDAQDATGTDAGRWKAVGGSAIAAPGATYLAEPVFEKEQLVIADLDQDLVRKNHYLIDNQGHYARPDVFGFELKQYSAD